MTHTLRRLHQRTKMIAHTGLQIFWIFFLSLTTLSTELGSSPQYHYLPSGSLPCKTYNKTKVDCSDRDFVQVPTLDQNFATSLDLSYNLLPNITGVPFKKLKVLLVLMLSSNEITQLSATAFRGIFSLGYLYLDSNELSDLPRDIFVDLSNLIHLDLSYNQFTAIPSQALSLLQSLQHLYFSPAGYHFAEIDLSGFKNLPNLKKLELSVKNLQTDITSYTFQQLSYSPLQEFTFEWFWKSDQYTIDRETFAPLDNLTSLTTSSLALPALQSACSPLYHLELHYKPVKYSVVNITTFQVLQNFNSTLTHLTLIWSFTPPQLIDDYSFIWTPNLIILELKWSFIKHLAKHAFFGLNSLQKLTLHRNYLFKVPSEALEVFRKSATLQHLDLSSNWISNIPQDAFAAVSSSLTHLNMDNNFLQSLVSTTWLNLFRKLNHISLKGIIWTTLQVWLKTPLLSLRNFEIGNFALSLKRPLCSAFPNLEVVVITSSRLENFPSDLALHKCSYLFHLDLSGSVENITSLNLDNCSIIISTLNILKMTRNHLTSIKQAIFITAPMLAILDLSYNSIKSIDSDIAVAYPNLKSLNIDGNGLESIAGLQGLSFLQKLSATQNEITSVPSYLLTSFLMVLDLSTNPFNCTCDIEPFRKWILSDTNTWLQPGQYTCATPETFKEVSITAIELDCGAPPSQTPLYLGVGFAAVVMFCTLIFVFKYRWHIKYKLFLLYRNYRPFPSNIEEDFVEHDLRHHAYVAYNDESAEDTAWVMDNLQPNMEEGPEPLQLFIKSRDSIPGHSIIESIDENIQQSRKTILVLSPNFVDSNWCHHEMEMAKMRFF